MNNNINDTWKKQAVKNSITSNFYKGLNKKIRKENKGLKGHIQDIEIENRYLKNEIHLLMSIIKGE